MTSGVQSMPRTIRQGATTYIVWVFVWCIALYNLTSIHEKINYGTMRVQGISITASLGTEPQLTVS